MSVGGQSVCLADAITSKRHHMLHGQKALAGMCAPTGRKKGTSVQLRCIKVTEKKFLFGAKMPIFSGMCRLCFLIEAPSKIVIFVFIYFMFI